MGKQNNRKNETVKFHVSMAEPLHAALTILADLEGMSLSEFFANLGRAELKDRGYAPLATGEKIAEELERRKKSGQREA